MTPETAKALVVSNPAAAPFYSLSCIPALNKSSAGHINPLRNWDLGPLTNFFDHAGNFTDGAAAASVAILAGVLGEGAVDTFDDQKHTRYLGATGLAAGTLATGVNVAYEAGISVPVFGTSPEDSFDYADAVYGSFAGMFVAAVFMAVAFREKLRRGRQDFMPKCPSDFRHHRPRT